MWVSSLPNTIFQRNCLFSNACFGTFVTSGGCTYVGLFLGLLLLFFFPPLEQLEFEPRALNLALYLFSWASNLYYCLGCFFFLLFETVSLCSPNWPWIHYPPASVSQLMRF
jgi:hypothetical protein